MAFASGSGSGSGSSYNFPPISSQGFFTYGGNSPEHSPTNTTQSGHDSDKENLGRARARRFLDEQRVTPNPDATLPTVEEVLDHLAGSVTPSDASSVVSSAGSPSPTTGNPATAHYPSWRSVVLLLSVDQWLTENDVRQWFPAISGRPAYVTRI